MVTSAIPRQHGQEDEFMGTTRQFGISPARLRAKSTPTSTTRKNWVGPRTRAKVGTHA
ncbi:MAG: hypothetical protein GY820_46135 [Gammaproteobacteria bacterium]|nr:hypothetical protein [Gammaproteobacteria bacterium]